MTDRMRTMMLAGGALLLATGLGACSDPEPESAPIENSAFDEEAPPPSPEPTFEPAPPPVVENLSAVAPADDLPPPPPIAPDEQVLDDASATGMTSRSTRGEQAQDTGTEDASDQTQQETEQ